MLSEDTTTRSKVLMSARSTANWRSTAGSISGRDHDEAQKPCEDAWAIQHGSDSQGNDIVALAVCDGAGSAAHGGRGARLTSSLVSGHLIRRFESFLENGLDAKQRLMHAIQALLQEEAESLTCELKDFACTLVAVACDSSGRWIGLHLGDGGLIGMTDEGMMGISLPMKGEFANETYFVTRKSAATEVRLLVSDDFQEPIKSFMLFSDGVEDLLLDSSGEVAGGARRLMAWLIENSEDHANTLLKTQLREFFKQHSYDDCTIGLVARADAIAPPCEAEAGTAEVSSKEAVSLASPLAKTEEEVSCPQIEEESIALTGIDAETAPSRSTFILGLIVSSCVVALLLFGAGAWLFKLYILPYSWILKVNG